MYILFLTSHMFFLIKAHLKGIAAKINLFPQHSDSEADYFHSSSDISFGGS